VCGEQAPELAQLAGVARDEHQSRDHGRGVGSAAAIFDEKKLRWVNGRYMRELPLEEYAEAVAAFLGREPDERLGKGCEIAQEKAQTLAEVWPLIRFLFEPPVSDQKAWRKVMGEGTAELLRAARDALAAADGFEPGDVEEALAPLLERLDVKPGRLYQPLRVAVTGTTVSPGIFETLSALGREATLSRIDEAVARLRRG